MRKLPFEKPWYKSQILLELYGGNHSVGYRMVGRARSVEKIMHKGFAEQIVNDERGVVKNDKRD